MTLNQKLATIQTKFKSKKSGFNSVVMWGCNYLESLKRKKYKDKFLKWLGVDAVKDVPKIDFVKAKKVLESKVQTQIEPLQ